MEGRGQQGPRAQSGTKPTSPQVDTFSPKLRALAERARRIGNEPLKTLMHLVDREWLQEAWKRLRKGSAAGIDHVTTADYEQALDANLEQLLSKLQHNQYRATPVRRVYISKSDGRLRPLGLPTVEDKLVQRAIELILTPIYEQEFLPMSYGFRPGRSAHQALEAVKEVIATKPVGWVLDVDLQSYFD
jgi:RNA-directed DNA polymerase